jgi:hypothetical protein
VKLSNSNERVLEFKNTVFTCLDAIVACMLARDGTEVSQVGSSFVIATRYFNGGLMEAAYGDETLEIAPLLSSLIFMISGLAPIGYILRRRRFGGGQNSI